MSPKGRQHVAIVAVGCRKAYISTRSAISLPFAQMSLEMILQGLALQEVFNLDEHSLLKA